MTLRLYNTASREITEFKPRREGIASVYLCGATPQGLPHIGHLRSAVAFDILRRWLAHTGYDVRFIRNVTDIDDKILTKAAAHDRPWWEWEATHERAFTQAYDRLGVLPPSVEPRATGHVTQMVDYMQRLIDRGYAYAAEGSVYFDVPAWISSPEGDYGILSGHKVDEVEQGETETVGKRDPRDFALWKAVKPGEPAWPTPWGAGRPGWHLECSVMATYYLGESFDIHGGGRDLMFPHHENEIAQAHAAGDGFATIWMHNGWVTMAGEKMSKSLGNTVSIPHMLEIVRPVELRYYLGSAQYRSMLEYSEEALLEAASAYRRVETFLLRARQVVGAVAPQPVPEAFARALDEDLGVPTALAVLHGTLRGANPLVGSAATEVEIERLRTAAGQIRAMVAVLGCDPFAENWQGAAGGGGTNGAGVSGVGGGDAAHAALDALVRSQIERRKAAREAKDWQTADAVRDALDAAGIVVTDTQRGAEWSLKEKK